MSSFRKLFEKDSSKFLHQNLKKLNIKKNDVVYFGLDLKNYFLPFVKHFKKNPVLLDNKYLCEVFLKDLKKYFLPKGTIVFPAFTWKFIKNKKFHPNQSTPELGIFEKYIFNKPGFLRSKHPVNSVVALGKRKKEIVSNHGSFSFGANSPFEKFPKLNLKFVNIGVYFYNSCTYTHHLEHINGLNHRYYKFVEGLIKDKNKYIKKKFFFLVKYKYFDKELKRDERKFYELLKRKKFAKELKIKNIIFSSINSKDVYREGLKYLKADPSNFMKNNIVVQFNESNKKLKNKKKLKIKFNLKI